MRFQLPASEWKGTRRAGMSHYRSYAVPLRDIGYAVGAGSDKRGVRMTMPVQDAVRGMSIPWAMEMKALSAGEPTRLVQTLTGAILASGGWVLSRGANDLGTVTMLFEFERQACVEIYSLLIAAGLELSQNGHIRFTELCQCTRNQQADCGSEIASIDLEIQTFSTEMVRGRSAKRAA
jgi:hypothetical protein